ncbi:hypothetical protein BOX15_Mlig011944g3 [Macrostomum lignano]|uniref:GP-PDE domain-containing protein n=1 Tax=Macrostomum lignano TaxID=282301 RepID=A0A267GFN7_9PLAT|nr:hypothetical protein BOX15_Mlig011944g3 [Macrostomum lignano]
MSGLRVLNACTVPLLLLLAATLDSAKTRDPFYIIAHMTNSPHSLDWSMRQGANAVEVDIQFDGRGNPTEFGHRWLCDCSCPHPRSYHICSHSLRGCSGRGASASAASHLRHMARLPGLALVILDGKVNSKWGDRLATAGANLARLVERELFGNGYRGNVVISAGKINCFEYVSAAAKTASGFSNKDRYYFAFDQEDDKYSSVAAMLSRFTRKRTFGTGISACLPGTYYSGIRQAVAGVRNGEIGLTYIWTLDKESSMKSYINLGVNGIITNRPGLLKKLAGNLGLRLAKPGDAIPTARTDVSSPNNCDCDYHWGGCTISSPAPPFKACRCKYKGFWTCGGSVVSCNSSNLKCRNPDGSKESCKLGGGDCGGYR